MITDERGDVKSSCKAPPVRKASSRSAVIAAGKSSKVPKSLASKEEEEPIATPDPKGKLLTVLRSGIPQSIQFANKDCEVPSTDFFIHPKVVDPVNTFAKISHAIHCSSSPRNRSDLAPELTKNTPILSRKTNSTLCYCILPLPHPLLRKQSQTSSVSLKRLHMKSSRVDRAKTKASCQSMTRSPRFQCPQFNHKRSSCLQS